MSQPTVSDQAWREFLAGLGEQAVDATISKVVPFGVLVTVGPGVPGLLPAYTFAKKPMVGATLAVRVVEIDDQRRRLRLATA